MESNILSMESFLPSPPEQCRANPEVEEQEVGNPNAPWATPQSKALVISNGVEDNEHWPLVQMETEEVQQIQEHQEMNSILPDLPETQEQRSTKYLGLPLGIGRSKKESFDFVSLCVEASPC
ncbi:MFS general substrate transporter [Striga asiatica]|uniref:MFS general substrate transporter n=1 Tax=Striga asiatica TaxID=4170 RepID=A0A5A7P3K2_STRAF|nr:MFS general substrate transporter [Striga asiatica]